MDQSSLTPDPSTLLTNSAGVDLINVSAGSTALTREGGALLTASYPQTLSTCSDHVLNTINGVVLSDVTDSCASVGGVHQHLDSASASTAATANIHRDPNALLQTAKKSGEGANEDGHDSDNDDKLNTSADERYVSPEPSSSAFVVTSGGAPSMSQPNSVPFMATNSSTLMAGGVSSNTHNSGLLHGGAGRTHSNLRGTPLDGYDASSSPPSGGALGDAASGVQHKRVASHMSGGTPTTGRGSLVGSPLPLLSPNVTGGGGGVTMVDQHGNVMFTTSPAGHKGASPVTAMPPSSFNGNGAPTATAIGGLNGAVCLSSLTGGYVLGGQHLLAAGHPNNMHQQQQGKPPHGGAGNGGGGGLFQQGPNGGTFHMVPPSNTGVNMMPQMNGAGGGNLLSPMTGMPPLPTPSHTRVNSNSMPNGMAAGGGLRGGVPSAANNMNTMQMGGGANGGEFRSCSHEAMEVSPFSSREVFTSSAPNFGTMPQGGSSVMFMGGGGGMMPMIQVTGNNGGHAAVLMGGGAAGNNVSGGNMMAQQHLTSPNNGNNNGILFTPNMVTGNAFGPSQPHSNTMLTDGGNSSNGFRGGGGGSQRSFAANSSANSQDRFVVSAGNNNMNINNVASVSPAVMGMTPMQPMPYVMMTPQQQQQFMYQQQQQQQHYQQQFQHQEFQHQRRPSNSALCDVVSNEDDGFVLVSSKDFTEGSTNYTTAARSGMPTGPHGGGGGGNVGRTTSGKSNKGGGNASGAQQGSSGGGVNGGINKLQTVIKQSIMKVAGPKNNNNKANTANSTSASSKLPTPSYSAAIQQQQQQQQNGTASNTVYFNTNASSNYAIDGSYFNSTSGNYDAIAEGINTRTLQQQPPNLTHSNRGTATAMAGVHPEAGTGEIFRGVTAKGVSAIGGGSMVAAGGSATAVSSVAGGGGGIGGVGGASEAGGSVSASALSRSKDKLLEEYRAASDAERQRYTLDMLLGHVVQFAVDAEGSRCLQRLLTEAFVSVWNHFEKPGAAAKGKGNTKTSQTRKQSLPELAANAPRAPSHLQPAILATLRDVFMELEQHMIDMVFDAYANYVVQRFIETQAAEFLRPMVTKCRTHPMFDLSQNDYGCRVIQNLLEACASENIIKDNTAVHSIRREVAMEEASIEREAAALVRELDHNSMVYKLIIDRNGNHVVQKCLMFYPQECAFIATAISDHFLELAKNVYGCRVIQCVFEQLKGPDVGFESSHAAYKLMLLAMEHCTELVNSQYGNFVVTHALINSPEPLITGEKREGDGGEEGGDGGQGTVGLSAMSRMSSVSLRFSVNNRTQNALTSVNSRQSDMPSSLPASAIRTANSMSASETNRGTAVESRLLVGGPSPTNTFREDYIDPNTVRHTIVDALIPNLLQLSCSKFASNVAQRLFHFADEGQKKRIVEILTAEAPSATATADGMAGAGLGMGTASNSATSVVPLSSEGTSPLPSSAAEIGGNTADTSSSSPPPLVAVMMMDQYANYVIQRILEECSEEQKQHAMAVVSRYTPAIHKSQYGKHIITKLFPEVAAAASSATGATPTNPSQEGFPAGGGNSGGAGTGGKQQQGNNNKAKSHGNNNPNGNSNSNNANAVASQPATASSSNTPHSVNPRMKNAGNNNNNNGNANANTQQRGGANTNKNTNNCPPYVNNDASSMNNANTNSRGGNTNNATNHSSGRGGNYTAPPPLHQASHNNPANSNSNTNNGSRSGGGYTNNMANHYGQPFSHHNNGNGGNAMVNPSSTTAMGGGGGGFTVVGNSYNAANNNNNSNAMMNSNRFGNGGNMMLPNHVGGGGGFYVTASGNGHANSNQMGVGGGGGSGLLIAGAGTNTSGVNHMGYPVMMTQQHNNNPTGHALPSYAQPQWQ